MVLKMKNVLMNIRSLNMPIYQLTTRVKVIVDIWALHEIRYINITKFVQKETNYAISMVNKYFLLSKHLSIDSLGS
jgi:hypothetical protein